VRTAAAFLLVAGLAVSLAACSPTNSTDTGDCVPTKSGSASDSVKVSGDFGAEPKVEFDEPLTLDATQRTVDLEGKGKDIADGSDIVTIDFVMYNATSGTRLTASTYDGTNPFLLPLDDEGFLPGLVKTLSCSTEGSRIVGVITPEDGFGKTGNADLGVGPTDPMIFVADVVKVEAAPEAPKVPETEDYSTSEGLPTVVIAESGGAPVVTIPDTEPPAEWRIALIEEGDGDEVAATETAVTVNYQGTDWQTGAVFDDSWARGAPATFDPAQTVPGFGQALYGQKVGSTILITIPPDLGYGPSGGNPDAGIAATDTIVFVVTIVSAG
jgi:peptidylprolyl isomerase